jgi:hypothetical protein
MNIKGLDYNTSRNKLVMPEYGREVQKMVEYAMQLPNKQDRQRCAQAIIDVMGRMQPRAKMTADYRQKLWDHLAIMSDFKLDIDWPPGTQQADTYHKRPAPMPYPMQRIPVRHYGKLVFELLEKLKNAAPGPDRDHLMVLTANQMKRDLVLWGHGSNENERVAADLERFTDGRVHLDLSKVRLAKVETRVVEKKKKRR